MNGFKLKRLGMIIEPEPDNPMEVEGILNPAAIRGLDGELYLFPRMVAKGNYSRIGIAKVLFNDASIFPVTIPNHAGKMQLALLHRPLFQGTRQGFSI